MRFVFTLLAILAITPFHGYSQQDTGQVLRDSLSESRLALTTRLLRENDSLLKADASQKQNLENQLLLISSQNESKRRELVKRIIEFEQADSIQKAARLDKINALKGTNPGFPVVPFRDTIFYIYNKLGPLQPKDRAANINRKMQQLANDPFFSPDSIKITPNENNVDVTYSDLVLFTITEDDALWLNKDQITIANNYISSVKKAIQQNKDENSLKNLLIRIGWLLLIIVIFSLAIFGINRLFRRLYLLVLKEKDKYFKGLKVKDYALLNQKRQVKIIYNFLRVAKVVVILFVLYLTLPFVFGIFPWTRGIADSLIDWTLSPIKRIFSAFLNYLPKLLTIAVIYLITHYLAKLINYLADEISKGNLTIKGFYPDWAKPTSSGIKFLLYAFMFIVIFPYLPGSDSKIFQGVSVFLGILFSLGSSSAISNIVAGFVITYMRPFKIGDRVKIGDITGDVIEKNLLVTRLRTIKNEEITVPNASILNGHTINFTTSSKDLGLILHTNITIGYEVPWPKVHDLLIQAALKTEGVLKDRAPFVLQKEFQDFSVAYEINVYTDDSHKIASIQSNLHQHIQDAFNEAGIEIMSPHFMAQRDGNTSTVPPGFLPENYQAPAFRVDVKKE
ncbi:mechanosensitive ion channel family protein [Chitinophaga silvatica]|uniref:Mechanosensitive ion channel family protein n=1 Tax=Chitinophaga silvatica TaxID=2282649 RepID=A0A3E1YBH1_9BACT|nr:mechanosensitive ion channel family protein [Chitinophaga silvatica]RFS23413.1 mechanosensitive ion channel family protein [Chitinophaga silvatica]